MTAYIYTEAAYNVSTEMNDTYLSNFDLLLDEGSIWNNVIEDFKQSQLTLNEPATLILMVVYVLIFLTSLVGNGLVLLVIVPNQRMWTVTNNFLVNLAVADLLVTLLCMPMTLAGKVYKLWIYGDVLCKMTPYLQGVSVAASTFTITAMSLDRCLAILYPVKFRNMRTKRNVRLLITLLWLAASCLMIPLLIVNKTKSQMIFSNFQIITCAEDWQNITQRRAYDFSLLFIVCLIPAQIVFVSYLLMGKRLWVTDSRLKGDVDRQITVARSSERGSLNTVRAGRRRTAKMCIVVSIVFVVCWIPYYTVNIHLDFKRDEDVADIFHWVLFVGHLHCITNPILYCFMHKSFRYGTKRLLPCWNTTLNRAPSGYGTNGFVGQRASSGKAGSRCTVQVSGRETSRDSPTRSTNSGSNITQTLINGNKHTKPRKVRIILTKLRKGKNKKCDNFRLEEIKNDVDRSK